MPLLASPSVPGFPRISSSEYETHEDSDQKPYSPCDNRRPTKGEANFLPRYRVNGWIWLHVEEGMGIHDSRPDPVWNAACAA